jgi:hypothetical protein
VKASCRTVWKEVRWGVAKGLVAAVVSSSVVRGARDGQKVVAWT